MKRTLAVFLICCIFLVGSYAQSTGPTFYYVLTTVDATGLESAFSTEIAATFTQGKHITTLSWVAATVPTGGAAVAGYNVYRGTASGGPYVKVNPALVTAVTYSDTFVLPNAPSGITKQIN